MHNSKFKILFRAAAFCLLLAMLLSLCNYALYDDRTYTRLMMHELYEEEEPIDLVFIGGSITYKGFVPEIWEEELGMNAFNLGSSSQTLDDTYYLMREVFRTQSPRYCIYSTTHISFMDLSDYENPQRHYILFDYFKPSFNKLAYWADVFDEHTALTALLPFMRNKTISPARIRETMDILKAKRSEDYRSYGYGVYAKTEEEYRGQGYVYRFEAKPAGGAGKLEPVWFEEQRVKAESVEYFAKLAQLCRENDCELIMIPTPMPYGTMALQTDYQQIADFYQTLAEENGVEIFDFSMSCPELFEAKDEYFYDHVHMNGPGSQVFSKAAASVVKDHIAGNGVQKDKLFYTSFGQLMEDASYVFNTWLEEEDGEYAAYSTQGSGVEAEYRFLTRTGENDAWQCIQEYGQGDSLDMEQISEDVIQIRVEARGKGSGDEYQQFAVLDR